MLFLLLSWHHSLWLRSIVPRRHEIISLASACHVSSLLPTADLSFRSGSTGACNITGAQVLAVRRQATPQRGGSTDHLL
ncbi:Os07g0680700 [Oryza sativa Japonica Group]|uniref:Os07g0680700 protein n=1 Tax=Oryza sativa subsp. japonica TaxID=39947 RepID=A0A0P0XAG8_ORYSJ|nr:hypothetical protein EE612_041401 [Oryza sativa]BAT03237.1 Os07g0680700 [Oryza sativa Japonica Group]